MLSTSINLFYHWFFSHHKKNCENYCKAAIVTFFLTGAILDLLLYQVKKNKIVTQWYTTRHIFIRKNNWLVGKIPILNWFDSQSKQWNALDSLVLGGGGIWMFQSYLMSEWRLDRHYQRLIANTAGVGQLFWSRETDTNWDSIWRQQKSKCSKLCLVTVPSKCASFLI